VSTAVALAPVAQFLWSIYTYDTDATQLNCRRQSPTVTDSLWQLRWVESRRRRKWSVGVFARSSKRPANFQQTSNKRLAIHVYFEYICWTFAGSCKHPIIRLFIGMGASQNIATSHSS